MKNKKGFSLLEILVGVVLLAIVTGIGSVQYGKYMDQGKRYVVNAVLNKLQSAFIMCLSMNNNKLSECTDLNDLAYTKPSDLYVRMEIQTGTPRKTCFIVSVPNDPDNPSAAAMTNPPKGQRVCAQFDGTALKKRCKEKIDGNTRKTAGCSSGACGQTGGDCETF